MKKINLNNLFKQSLNNKVKSMIRGGESGQNDCGICGCACKQNGNYSQQFNVTNGNSNKVQGKASPAGGILYSDLK